MKHAVSISGGTHCGEPYSDATSTLIPARVTCSRCLDALLDVETIALQLLWVSAHHGLRRCSMQHDPHDAAPYPWLTRHSMLWGYVYDVTAELGHPVAPGGR